MKKTLALLFVFLSLALLPGLDAEAKRLGAGKSSGMQGQSVTAPRENPGVAGTPGQPGRVAGAPAAAAVPGAAAAATPTRGWMGAAAGIAAGLGLAALASHLGFGETMANMMAIALLVIAALVAAALVARWRAANHARSLARAGGPQGVLRQLPQPADRNAERASHRMGRTVVNSGLGVGAGHIPAGFDVAAFERNALDQFMVLQAANDAKDLDRLGDHMTPELFEMVRAEIAERGEAPQKTEVYGLQAQVLNVAEERSRYVVSVRFDGRVRDRAGETPEDLDEVWHLVKPRSGFGGWEIAGIQQAGGGLS